MAKKTNDNVVPATSLVGTPDELIKAGVTLNDYPVDKNTFAFLRKYHYDKAIKMAGYAPKPAGQKGKSPERVELLNTDNFVFHLPNAAEVAE